MYKSKAVRCAGIVLADDLAKERTDHYVLRPPVEATMLVQNMPGAERVLRNGRWYQLVFSDGSIRLQGRPWLAHGGWGLYVGAGGLVGK